MSNDQHSNFPITGKCVIFSAPSGAGKTSLCRELIDRFAGLRQSVSFTTRQARVGEVDGVDYHFVEPTVFQQMVDNQQLAEWAEVHGNSYGTSLDTLSTAAGQGVDLLLCGFALNKTVNFGVG